MLRPIAICGVVTLAAVLWGDARTASAQSYSGPFRGNYAGYYYSPGGYNGGRYFNPGYYPNPATATAPAPGLRQARGQAGLCGKGRARLRQPRRLVHRADQLSGAAHEAVDDAVALHRSLRGSHRLGSVAASTELSSGSRLVRLRTCA